MFNPNNNVWINGYFVWINGPKLPYSMDFHSSFSLGAPLPRIHGRFSSEALLLVGPRLFYPGAASSAATHVWQVLAVEFFCGHVPLREFYRPSQPTGLVCPIGSGSLLLRGESSDYSLELYL